MRERAKLHMTSSFFFSNNFSTLPNDKIVGRSKLEAFAEELTLNHELFSVMIGWKTFKTKRENCCLTAFSSFLSMFFQSRPSSIGLASFNPKPFNMPRFSDILQLPIENHRYKAQITTPDWIKFKIPIFVHRIELVCARIKNENSDQLL